jgi:hypothetical protein
MQALIRDFMYTLLERDCIGLALAHTELTDHPRDNVELAEEGIPSKGCKLLNSQGESVKERGLLQPQLAAKMLPRRGA